ncbi:hypothetical protein [Enterococcus faecalis]|uniref:hypothetical protein n=1 Tax=Enterococcus faecalis TaxID=1351 RepID=UPI001D17CAB8|nr:hypothetical protein [Enterococcus faecalis]MCC4085385.1 hypothetical protein [Enterococcus faecalis]HAP4186033.1 hypothetical protein [Enterococcus faecalis]
MKMKKKRFILLSFLLMMVVLIGGYKYDVSNFENDINLELANLKNKQEIKDYTIHSEENKGLKKVYAIEVEHTNERKEKYPKKIVITYNPFVLQKDRLDFNLN